MIGEFCTGRSMLKRLLTHAAAPDDLLVGKISDYFTSIRGRFLTV